MKDRIVEISVIKVYPDGHDEVKTRRLHPEMPIPAESTAIHHITDEDVKDCPTFKQIAKSLMEMFADSDIAGYNSNKFDLPLLIEEFGRAGLPFDLNGRRFIDVQNIFHKMEQRTLVAAYKFYCGRELTNAHGAEADTRATYEVLMSQLDRYDTLKNDVAELAKFSSGDKNLDLSARFVYNDKKVPVFNFGKYKGQPVVEIFRREPGFYQWMMQGDFPKNTKDVATYLYQESRKK